MRKIIRIHPRDNVAVALEPLAANVRLDDAGTTIVVASEVPSGHKVSLTKIESGQPIFKFGFPIGRATRRIDAGEWVHSHNLETALGDNVEYHYSPEQAKPPMRDSDSTFRAETSMTT